MDRTSAASRSLPFRGAGPLVVGLGVLGHAAIRQLHRLPLLGDVPRLPAQPAGAFLLAAILHEVVERLAGGDGRGPSIPDLSDLAGEVLRPGWLVLAAAAVAIAGLTILPAALAGMVREGGPGGLDLRRVLGSTLRAPGRALTSWLLFVGAAGIAQTRPLASFPAGSTPLRGFT